ncbi:3-oxoadipate enol-lactonase 2 [Pigmentiphaga humi]|uniref:3-oxoadipate enol-lactonase 2 n=1 Tax=Pigmentiphaga humi TaxID=2478468 RepID=A0A3P4B5Y7_9BURK|nr:alpha/beta hydrolase [Pigmentiphaga humi]VCU70936.1 3-oxoadipate enol-lactonase 2 [Pigmentiphaga humi]
MTQTPHPQFASAQDGTRIAYALHGDPASRRRIALVHSLAMDHTFWDSVVAHLGTDVAVAAIDARGHGRSGRPAGPYRVETFADDLAAVLDALGWERAAVGGASMGGSVALAFAIRHPGRTAGLGLFDTTAWYGASAPADWEDRGQKAVREGLASLIAFQETRWFTDEFRSAHPDVVARCKEVFLANDVPAYLETCRMLGNMDQRGGLAGIAVPTRILVGEEDYATPVAMAQALADAIAGSTLRVLPRARHLSPLEYPQDVAACLRELARG